MVSDPWANELPADVSLDGPYEKRPRIPDSRIACRSARACSGVWMLCSQPWIVVMPLSTASARPKRTLR
jgi:hypothetical protein